MSEYKMLTPKFREEINNSIDQLLEEINNSIDQLLEEINNSIDQLLEEIKTCEKNVLTEMQFESLSALKTLIGRLPDGYLIPMKEGYK